MPPLTGGLLGADGGECCGGSGLLDRGEVSVAGLEETIEQLIKLKQTILKCPRMNR